MDGVFATDAIERFEATQLLPSQGEERGLPSPKNDVWGLLQPHNKSMTRINLNKPIVVLGRWCRRNLEQEGTQKVVLNGILIS